MAAVTRAALEKVAVEAAAASPNVGTVSDASTYSQEACIYNCTGPNKKAMLVDLSKPESEATTPVMLDWPEGRMWEETPTPLQPRIIT